MRNNHGRKESALFQFCLPTTEPEFPKFTFGGVNRASGVATPSSQKSNDSTLSVGYGYTRGNVCGEFRSIGTFLSGSGGLLQLANLFDDLRYHFVCLPASNLHFSQLSAHGSKLSAHHNALMTHFSRLSSNFPERTNCDDDTGDANQAENDLRHISGDANRLK